MSTVDTEELDFANNIIDLIRSSSEQLILNSGLSADDASRAARALS